MTGIMVQNLQYKLKTDESLSFKNPEPIGDETEHFSMVLADDTVTFDLKSSCGSVQAARGMVEDYLEAWKIAYNLSSAPGTIDFEFKDADISRRATQPQECGKSVHIHLSASAIANAIGSPQVSVHVETGEYPPPPSITASADVKSMYDRYMGYRAGREPLQGMAYFCYTVITYRTGGVKEARDQYKVSRNVLKTLRRLSSWVGDMKTARKVPDEERPLTDVETRWIEGVIRQLIIRMGEHAADPDKSFEKLTMNDFPTLG